MPVAAGVSVGTWAEAASGKAAAQSGLFCSAAAPSPEVHAGAGEQQTSIVMVTAQQPDHYVVIDGYQRATALQQPAAHR